MKITFDKIKTKEDLNKLAGKKIKVVGNRTGTNTIGLTGIVTSSNAFVGIANMSNYITCIVGGMNRNYYIDDIEFENTTKEEIEKEFEALKLKTKELKETLDFMNKNNLTEIDDETIKIYKILGVFENGIEDKMVAAKAIKQILQ